MTAPKREPRDDGWSGLAHDKDFSVHVHRERGEYRVIRRDPSSPLRFPELRQLAEALYEVAEHERTRLAAMAEDRLRKDAENERGADGEEERHFLGGGDGG